MQAEPNVAQMRVAIEMIHPFAVERGRTSLNAMDDVAPVEEVLGEMRAVLAGYPGDQSNFVSHRFAPPVRRSDCVVNATRRDL